MYCFRHQIKFQTKYAEIGWKHLIFLIFLSSKSLVLEQNADCAGECLTDKVYSMVAAWMNVWMHLCARSQLRGSRWSESDIKYQILMAGSCSVLTMVVFYFYYVLSVAGGWCTVVWPGQKIIPCQQYWHHLVRDKLTWYITTQQHTHQQILYWGHTIQRSCLRSLGILVKR